MRLRILRLRILRLRIFRSISLSINHFNFHHQLIMASTSSIAPVKKLPVTVLSGFLGSGKTTLLRHILRSKDHGLRCAVIVNDMAEVNIDGATIQNNQLIQREEKLVQMQNGCICCTLREDLLEEINRLAAEGRFDYLIIESTGVSEPMQVAETFTTDYSEALQDTDDQNLKQALQSLAESAKLDTCVSMVDASTFFSYFNSSKFLAETFKDAEEEDEKTVVDLLVDQIEFADVIVINKIDTVSKEKVKKIEEILKSLNKVAKIVKSEYSKVDMKEILNTGLFDMDKAMTSSGWLRSLNEEVNPETIEYGISSFIYRERRPFHPKRLYDLMKQAFLVIEKPGMPDYDEEGEDEMETGNTDDEEEMNQEEEEEMTQEEDDEKKTFDTDESEVCFESKSKSVFKNLLRSKGFLWIAGKNEFMGDWSQAGIIVTVTNAGSWFADNPEALEMQDEEVKEQILREFDGPNGDRRQEIVFIGDFKTDKEKADLKLALDSCLMKENETFDSETDPWEEWC